MSDRKQFVVNITAPKKIAKIQFGTMTPDEMRLAATVQVSNRELFVMPNRAAAPFGCMDSRLGVSDKISACKTCNKKLTDCSGHFGFIQLELPVFHPGYFRHVLTIMQCICKNCSRILLPFAEKDGFIKKLKGARVDALMRSAIFKKIVERCKRVSQCPYCEYANGVVKKVNGGCFKITHEKFRAKNADEQHLLYQRQMSDIAKSHTELKTHANKQVELINPMRAWELVRGMVEEDLLLLWMQGMFSRPESLIMWSVPVPPVPIRPSVPQDGGGGGSTEDDITMKLQEIIEMNNALKVALGMGAAMKMVAEDWDFLQVLVALLINGDTPGIPRQMMGPKAVRGLCQRLKGKTGRFRGNLSGKRVDFSSRTVISPDPNLQIDQLGVPERIAKIMTFPERVNQYNIQKLRAKVLNGPDVHPGANIIRSGEYVSALQYADREKAAFNLKIGDIVERHLHDDDRVLFNRQPSLHKMSIMSHRVKVVPWRTFRFNECACTPYNADFDGDEMNMHLPQTEEAKAEAAQLMSITNNLITPRNGEPLVAATQDFLTGAYLITMKDVFFNKADFCRVVTYFSDALEEVELPLPAIIKPVALWTGKQVMSLLVIPNKSHKTYVNVETEERFYTTDKHFCWQDGFVAYRNGELLSGNLGKKTLGGDTKVGLFYVLIRDYGPQEATRCMSRLAKVCARYLGDRGFSIGIEDVTPSPKMVEVKGQAIAQGQGEAQELIDAYKAGKTKLRPGCNALQSLESDVNGTLAKVREFIGKAALTNMNYRNAPLCMAQCGSKGSALNITQMVACLGQQSVGGQRIQDGFVNRTLPHFPVGSLTPAAKGFVVNSFYSGLLASEFFFHTMGGREGLVDTAVKTAETGYMARRLMKALEDLFMQYDMTVRNSENTVVQFSYGDDGLNPNVMEKGDRPVDYDRMTTNICARNKDEKNECLTSAEIVAYVQAELSLPKFKELLPQGKQFLDETLKFFTDIAEKMKGLEMLETGSDSDSSKSSSKSSSESKITVVALRTKLRAMTEGEKLAWQRDAVSDRSSLAYKEGHRLLRDNTLRLTHGQMSEIFAAAYDKYNFSRIEPGEAVGAVGAQSISEPGTQMTLKTFHFAGVASMNVTLGVPRLKEIINASSTISTPIIEARLLQNDSAVLARIVKAQIEKTTLGDICSHIREVHDSHQIYVSVKINMKLVNALHLNINLQSIRSAIVNNYGGLGRAAVLRTIKDKHILFGKGNNTLLIYPPEPKETSKGIALSQKGYFVIQALKAALPGVIIQGIPTVSRAVINEETVNNQKTYYLLVEGYGLDSVMGCRGVDGTQTKTNHIFELQRVLGIEAARSMIGQEIKNIMSAYGITVDVRHLVLLSDVMTFKGEVLGITRFGVAKMKESVLMLASFEKTTDHLFDAAVHSREDSIVGVSECIIMGVPIPLGTGLFKMIHKAHGEGTNPASTAIERVKIQPRKRLLQNFSE